MENESKRSDSFVKNVLFVIFGNVLSLVVGIISGFIIPKILSVDNYGYYKTFTLYTTYVGILHFGFIDGILLKYAGKKQEEIDLPHFRMLTRFLFVFEIIVSLIGIGISLIFLSDNTKLIFIFISINLIAVNLTSLYEYITQITMDFKRMSLRSVIRTVAQLAVLIVLLIVFYAYKVDINPYLYIGLLVVINFGLLVWYLVTYNPFLFGESNKFSFGQVFPYFKTGFPLMVCNLVVMLICSIDQIFVNILFDNETYAYYAFAYSMISIITTMTSAISVVLFPTLKKIDSNPVEKYPLFNSYILIFGGLSLAAYQVFEFIVLHFLDKYTQSLSVLHIVMPVVLLTSPIVAVKYNFFKKENMIKRYFIESIIILILSIVADIAMYYLFRNVESISIVSIVICYVWYLVVEITFYVKYKIKWLKNALYMTLSLTAYYLLFLINNMYLSFGIYVAFIILLTLFFYHNILFEKIKRKKIIEKEF